jgi:hypothetical protein
MDARRARLPAICAGVALSAAAVVGCAPTGEPVTPSPAESSTTSGSPVPPEVAELPAVPEVADGEIARAVLTADGPGGVPETAFTSSGLLVADETFRIEGACVGGDRVEFDLLSAAVGDSGQTLASGAITCDGSVQDAGAWATPFSGPAQFAVTFADGVEDAWLVALPSG